MFLYTMMWMLVHPTHLVLLCAPPSNEILCGSLSLVEIMLFCVCVCVCVCVCATTAKEILFFNHRKKKVVGGKHNLIVYYVDASASDTSGIVTYNPFLN